ncbi:MAG: AsmA family protein [Rhodobacteraceae bacterium]|nr:AsmA family protein [Paracoccaceae bacterium]
MPGIDSPRSRRPRTRHLLLVLAGLLLVVVGSASWLLLDRDRLRSALEAGISTLSDRPFHIDGEFDIRLGRVTTIRGSDVRWLNPAWSQQPDMLTVKKLSLSIDVLSLLKGPIVISDAQAEDARLLFEWNEEGQFNWQMTARQDKADDKSNPLRLLLSQSELRRVEIRVRHPALTAELVVDVVQASERHDAQDRLLITSEAVVDNRPLSLQGRIGPFAELIAGGAIDYDFTLAAAIVSLKASGHFDRLDDPKKPRFDLELRAADAGELLQALALPEVTSGQVQLQARVAPADERLASVLEGNFGEFNIDVRLLTTSITSVGEFSLALSSDGPRVGALARLAGVDHLPDKPYSLQVDASRSAQRLQVRQLSFRTDGITLAASGVANKLPQPRDLDVDITLTADNAATVGKVLSLAWLPALPLHIEGSVKSNGRGHKDALHARLELGNIDGELSGELSEERDFAGSTFSYRGSSPDLRQLARARGLSLPAAVAARLEVDLALLSERLRISRLAANIDDNQLAARGVIDFGRAGSAVELEPQMTGPDLGNLARLFLGDEQAAYFPGGRYDLAGRLALTGKRLTISSGTARAGNNVLGFDGTVDFSTEMPQVTGKLMASGNDLAELLKPTIIKAVPAGAFSLRTALQVSDRGIALDDLQFSLGDSRLSGRLATGWPGKPEQIAFDLTAAGSDLRASLPEIPGYVAAPAAFRIEARGMADQASINIEGLDGKIADAHVALAGKLVLKPSLSAAAMRLSASGAKLSDLGRVKEWPLPDLPFAVAATMTGSENRLGIDDLQLTLGDSDLKGSLRINTLARPEIDLNVQSNYLHLEQLLPQGKAQTSGGSPEGKRHQLFSDEALHLEALRDFDGKLQASLRRVDGEHRQMRNVLADATLKDGLLVVKQLQADGRRGTLKSSFSVDGSAEPLRVQGSLKAVDAVFAIRGMSDADRDQLPPLDVDSGFSASGNSISALAAGLDGYFWLRAAKGRMPSLAFAELYGDFASLLMTTLNPFVKKDPYSSVRCAGMYFEARQGQVKTAPAVIVQTDKLSIVARGTIDLRSEHVDLAFKTTPLQGVGLSAGDIINPFIMLGGTLQAPALRLDVENAAIAGGVAAATAGMSILATSLWDRWIGSFDGCAKVLDEARKIRRTKNPADVPGF